MPLEPAYLNRCIQEDAHDTDVFHGFASVLLLRPTELLMRALRRKVGLKRPIDPAGASLEVSKKQKGKARM